MKTIKLLAILFIATLTFSACSDDHHGDDHDHEEELITTVTYTLTNGSDVVTMTYRDLDGDGGNPGTIDVSGPLTANTNYMGSITVLNETVSPAEDKTSEILAEGVEHEFFFSTTVAGVTVLKTDQDTNGNPIGIQSTLTTGTAGSGSLTMVLKHQPTKPNNDTAAGAGGSTDVEVTFSISVQ